MRIDWNRLNNVMFNNNGGRRIGKSFVKCCELCYKIKNSNKHLFICRVGYMRDVEYIVKMLVQLTEKFNIKFHQINEQRGFIWGDLGFNNKFEIRFISKNVLGYDRDVCEFVNFIDYYYDKFNRRVNYYEI